MSVSAREIVSSQNNHAAVDFNFQSKQGVITLTADRPLLFILSSTREFKSKSRVLRGQDFHQDFKNVRHASYYSHTIFTLIAIIFFYVYSLTIVISNTVMVIPRLIFMKLKRAGILLRALFSE